MQWRKRERMMAGCVTETETKKGRENKKRKDTIGKLSKQLEKQ